MAKKTVDQLFADADTKWICPVTGTKFDRADVTAIAEHKEKVIKEHAEREMAKKNTATRRKFVSRFNSVSTFAELALVFKDWAKFNGVKLSTVSFSPVIIPSRSNAGLFVSDFVEVNCKELSAAGVRDLAAINVKESGGIFIYYLPESKLKEKVKAASYKGAPSSLNAAMLVELKASNPAYYDNVEQIKELSAKVSAMRETISKLEKTNAETRKIFLAKIAGKLVFDSI